MEHDVKQHQTKLNCEQRSPIKYLKFRTKKKKKHGNFVISKRAFASRNAISSYFTIQKTILSIILYHFTTHPTSQNSFFFFFPFYLNILFYSFFFFFYYFSFSIPFPLSLPQPLAPVSTYRATHTETHDIPIHRSTYPNPSPHTESHTYRNTNHQTIN